MKTGDGRPLPVKIEYISRPWQAIGGLPDNSDHDEHIGRTQLEYLARCLADAPYLAADLEIAMTRQDHFPNRPTVTGDGTESPLPYRQSAANAAARLWFTITSVAALVWHRATHGQSVPAWSGAEAAEWLRSSLSIMAQDPDAEQFAHRICEAHDRAMDGPIERPPEWRYLGRCPACAADLEAQPGQIRVTCACGWTRDTAAVIAAALETAQDMLFTDTQLVGALELDGRVVTRDQIKGWARRGRLTPHVHHYWTGGGDTGRPGKIVTVRTFRLSEVRRVAADLEARKARGRS